MYFPSLADTRSFVYTYKGSNNHTLFQQTNYSPQRVLYVKALKPSCFHVMWYLLFPQISRLALFYHLFVVHLGNLFMLYWYLNILAKQTNSGQFGVAPWHI